MSDLTSHSRRVRDYYNEQTEKFYIRTWHDTHIHFGLFEKDEKLLIGRGKWVRAVRGKKIQQMKTKAMERMIEAVVEPIGIPAGGKVVDAGCGIGGTALYIAKHHDCSVVGVNISDEQLRMATERAEKAGAGDSVTFEYANCSSHLPFDDDSIDIVVSIESACHYDDRQKFVAECARILKAGGKLSIVDWMAKDGLSPLEYQNSIQPICDSWHLQDLETPGGYVEKMEEVGFELLASTDLTHKAIENARLMDHGYRKLSWLPWLPPTLRLWEEQFRSISSAWLKGDFLIFHHLGVLQK